MNRKRLICLFIFFGHKFEFVGRDGDWLTGGTYHYKCSRCGLRHMTRPYQGGFL